MKLGIVAVTTFVCLGGFLTAPAFAQGGSTPAPASTAASAGTDYHGDYEAGIDLLDRVRDRGVTTTYAPGWYAGASYRIIHVASVVGEIGGDYKAQSGGSALYVYTFSGGARFQSGSKAARVRPFAQLMFGSGLDNGGIGAHATRNHYPVLTPGGGADLRIGRHLAARVKLDFPLYATFGDVHKGLRLSIGASIPVGTK